MFWVDLGWKSFLLYLNMVKKKKKPAKPPGPRKQVLDNEQELTTGVWLGSMKGQIKFIGDILFPANDEDEWEVLRN